MKKKNIIIEVSSDYPSSYKIEHLVHLLKEGEVIAVPTDTCYALACLPNQRTAVEKMVRMRHLDPKKPRALVFSSVQQISTYTLLDDVNFRILRRFLPGPYCFILESNRKLPRFVGDKRRHIGVRIPKHSVVQAILEKLECPLTVSSAVNPEDSMMLYDPWSIKETFGHSLAAIVDAGDIPGEVSSVINLTGEVEVIREGRGDVSLFL